MKPDLKSWRGKRKIVLHHAHLLSGIASLLLPGDLLFLDDCLYSQHVWFKQNYAELTAKQIDVVFGLSTALVRPAGQPPEMEASGKLHARWHSGDSTCLAGFMSEAELREDLQLTGVWLACHGHRHLDLKRFPEGLTRTAAFRKDLAEAKASLARSELKTEIFVYPYAFWQFPLSEAAVREAGFRASFAGRDAQRTAIEELAACQI